MFLLCVFIFTSNRMNGIPNPVNPKLPPLSPLLAYLLASLYLKPPLNDPSSLGLLLKKVIHHW